MDAEGFGHRQVQSIVGITHRQLDEWDRQGFVKPSITKKHGRGRKRVYSFQDLVVLRTAKYLRGRGVSLNKLKRCLRFIQKSYPDRQNALAEMTFATDGKSVFVFDPDANTLADTLKGGQLLLGIALGKFAEELQGKVLRLPVRNQNQESKARGQGNRPKTASADEQSA